MYKFIHRQNIELYRKHLAEATNDVQRQTLTKLLADEEAKDLIPSIPSTAVERPRPQQQQQQQQPQPDGEKKE